MQFSKDTKNQEFDFDQDGASAPKANLQTSTSTTNGSNSENVGHPNKSKVMRDLFGIETADNSTIQGINV